MIQPVITPPGRDYLRARLDQHTHDSYMDVPMSKFPEDLRVYERIMWDAHVDTVIELGTWHGGSALWFRDRLVTFSAIRQFQPRVITIDISNQADIVLGGHLSLRSSEEMSSIRICLMK